MTLVADICPRCGASVDTRTARERCTFCGARLRVTGAVQTESQSEDDRIAGLMELGTIASDAGRVDESLDYFNKVLEARPTHSTAWVCKGLVLGSAATLEAPALRAIVSCFEQAVRHAPDSDRDRLTRLCTGHAAVLSSGGWNALKSAAGGAPLEPRLLERLIGEIGDGMSFVLRHNVAHENQLRSVLTFTSEVSSRPIRVADDRAITIHLQPVTLDALAQLHNSAAAQLRARVPGARIPAFGARTREPGALRRIAIFAMVGWIVFVILLYRYFFRG